MKRQAMNVTIEQLRKLADDMFYEMMENNPKGLYKDTESILKQEFLTSIINETPECSDTWTLEK